VIAISLIFPRKLPGEQMRITGLGGGGQL